MSAVLKKMEECLYCSAPILARPDAGFVRCESCGRVMEVTRFTQEERRLTEAVDEAARSSERAAEELKLRMDALAKSQSEAGRRAVKSAEAAAQTCQEALERMRRQQEASEARELRNIYIQAENAQRAGRFEEAEKWYRQLLVREDGEAEIHWRLVLCRYGVEYVREQASGSYLPTICHMVVDSVLEDADYQAAVRCARSDDIRDYYEREARAIDIILNRYREARATEKPYDVFISVKQGDAEGKPTKDSIIAQELYYKLRDELGLRVFSSRISLAGHAGTEYEPYIMAALMSAKVMLVVSTCPDYINAPWVRNEWRRFRWLKDNQSEKRGLIAYLVGMSVKDVPAAMGDLQAISSDSVNAVDSLFKSICEIVGIKKHRNLTNLLELASISLEYGEFDKVEEYCEKALYLEPRCSEAYALRLCVEKRVRTIPDLAKLDQPIDQCVNFKKAVSFADEANRRKLQGYNQAILDRIEAQRLEKIYAPAAEELAQIEQAQPNSTTEAVRLFKRCGELAGAFRQMKDYRDSADLERKCRKQRDRHLKTAKKLKYAEALEALTNLEQMQPKDVEEARSCASRADALAADFDSMQDYAYSAQALKRCRELADRMRAYNSQTAQNAHKKAVRSELDRLGKCSPGSAEEARSLLQELAKLEKSCTSDAFFSSEEHVSLKSEILDIRKRLNRIEKELDKSEERARAAVREFENRAVTTRAEALVLIHEILGLMEAHGDFKQFTDGDSLRVRCEDRLVYCEGFMPSEADMQAARDQLDKLEKRRLMNEKQAQSLVQELDALKAQHGQFEGFPDQVALNEKCADLRQRFTDISNDLRSKREAREAVEALENRAITSREEALRLGADVQALMRAKGNFEAFSDGSALRARCDDLLTRCAQYLSESTGEKDSSKRSELEQSAWKELEQLEAESPETLEEAADLDERLRQLSKAHGDFQGYQESALLKARVAAKQTSCKQLVAELTDCAQKELEQLEAENLETLEEVADLDERLRQLSKAYGDFQGYRESALLKARVAAKQTACGQRAAELIDHMLKELEAEPATWQSAVYVYCELETIRTCTHNFKRLPDSQREDLCNRCEALKAQCDQAIRELQEPEAKGKLFGWSFFVGLLFFIGGIGLLGKELECYPGYQKILLIVSGGLAALSLLCEKLLCGKRFRTPGQRPWIKTGTTVLAAAMCLADVGSHVDLATKFAVNYVGDFSIFLILGGQSMYMIMSALESALQKEYLSAIVLFVFAMVCLLITLSFFCCL